VVLLNNHQEAHGPYTHGVRVDDLHGGRMATRHLLEVGHRRIAYVAGGEGNSTSQARQDGYATALAEAGVAMAPERIIPGNGRVQAGAHALPMLRSLAGQPTAVFCYNDVTAIGLLRAAREAGIRVPEDLAVVGFDDIPMAAYVYPALTTVAQPKFDLGRQAMEMAVTLIRSEPQHARDVVLRGRLIVRESCGVGRRIAVDAP
jgi:DNA-binding LacI/PurR family transcriptional regulator